LYATGELRAGDGAKDGGDVGGRGFNAVIRGQGREEAF